MSDERKVDRSFCEYIDQVEAQSEIDRLLADVRFQSPERNKNFLRFIATEYFEGRSETIKAYTIAVDVVGRPTHFDPSVDPIVRIEATRLSENAEARLKASIPQTARVSTDGSVKVDVSYSGEPNFQPIDGTSLSYAVNTNEQVIKVGDTYFVLKDGVWFQGASPTGPFTVAKAVPDEIYKIPPSSPVYNATYVRVYQTEPDAVWYGYTMGYLGAYLAWDTFVYGTG